MAHLRSKGTVVIYNAHTAKIIKAAECVLGEDCVITSGMDGDHDPDSRHYKAEALDFRGRHLSDVERGVAIESMQEILGTGYRVLASNDGAIHVQTA